MHILNDLMKSLVKIKAFQAISLATFDVAKEHPSNSCK